MVGKSLQLCLFAYEMQCWPKDDAKGLTLMLSGPQRSEGVTVTYNDLHPRLLDANGDTMTRQRLRAEARRRKKEARKAKAA
jgi:hypothetical protein